MSQRLFAENRARCETWEAIDELLAMLDTFLFWINIVTP